MVNSVITGSPVANGIVLHCLVFCRKFDLDCATLALVQYGNIPAMMLGLGTVATLVFVALLVGLGIGQVKEKRREENSRIRLEQKRKRLEARDERRTQAIKKMRKLLPWRRD
jgi:hypothetical protein